MQKADLTSRAVAGFIDLLLVIAIARLPDIIGFLAATGYILVRDGLFDRQSVGKKLIGLRIASPDDTARIPSYRESIIRNTPLAAAYLLFLIPYAGWVLGPLALAVEALTAIGDERGMRVGDLIAGTWTVQAALPASRDNIASSIDQQPDFGSPPGGDNLRNND
jgi:uncharacterized RDD family membrane protein YckC